MSVGFRLFLSVLLKVLAALLVMTEKDAGFH
jgi:hypothetical protein